MKQVVLILIFSIFFFNPIFADECKNNLKYAHDAFAEKQWNKALYYYKLIRDGGCAYDVSLKIKQCEQHLKLNIDTKDTTKFVTRSTGAIQKAVPPATLSVSQTEITAPSAGLTTILLVSSTRPWEVQFANSKIYSVERDGNLLMVVIRPNTSPENRSAYFNVKTTDGSNLLQQINIYQAK